MASLPDAALLLDQLLAGVGEPIDTIGLERGRLLREGTTTRQVMQGGAPPVPAGH